VGADIRWGVQATLVTTGIAFVPALLVATLSGTAAIRFVVAILVAYLLFAAVAGVLIGLSRPVLGRGVGAASVGAIIGSVGFVVLVCLPRPDHPFPGAEVAGVSAALGAVVGAFCGALFRRQMMSRDRGA